MRDICEYLGGRADKDFLGTGNIGICIQKTGARLLFIQKWIESGLGVADWTSGSVLSCAPDRVAMREPIPPIGARSSIPPSARWIFAAGDDVLGMTLEWQNETPHALMIQVSFTGRLPAEARIGDDTEASFLRPHDMRITTNPCWGDRSARVRRLHFHRQSHSLRRS